LRCRQIGQATPHPWSGPGRGCCGTTKGHDGAAARAKLPAVSSSPSMEFHVIDRPARGHRILSVDRAGGSCGPA
jgi:hypothetical protein